MDETKQVKVQEKLTQLIEKTGKKSIEYRELIEELEEFDLDAEGIFKVYDFLEKKGLKSILSLFP